MSRWFTSVKVSGVNTEPRKKLRNRIRGVAADHKIKQRGVKALNRRLDRFFVKNKFKGPWADHSALGPS